MTATKEAAVWGHLWQLVDLSKKLIADFETLTTEVGLAKKLPYVEVAYTDAIIVHLAKIYTKSTSEPFRLEEFRKIIREELKNEVDELTTRHKSTIGKIISHRTKLVAHSDKDFSKMPFSINEKERMAQDMARGMNIDLKEAKAVYTSMPKADEKSQERYTPRDLRDDLTEIKEMLEHTDSIWKRSLPLQLKRT